MCGATEGGPSTAGVDLGTATVIQGTVSRAGSPVGGAYVRLLDSTGEFTAEVVSSATGGFRFFAAPGSWTVRGLAAGARGDAGVEAHQGEASEVALSLS